MDYYRSNVVWDAQCTIHDKFALGEYLLRCSCRREPKIKMDYYSNNVVWNVWCSVHNTFALWPLYPERLLGMDRPIRSDEDPAEIINWRHGQDDAMVREGADAVLSRCCAEHVIENVEKLGLFGLWGSQEVVVTPAKDDFPDIHSLFGQWLTSDSDAGWVFVGSSSDGATRDVQVLE